ncbi:hypothetical protein J3R83DRAFT_9617 [Lanmaoa asiatica]|nr:hypothetical protein J3R83DRAFT_9617 [Lanmaoa asiatica]
MQAVAARKSVVTVAGVQVRDLTMHSASSDNFTSSSKDVDDTTFPGEFMAQGTIELFGNKDVTAEFDIWHGSPPPGVIVGSAAPSVQRAIIKGSVTLSQLIPSLNEVLHGADLSFQNVSIYHQNYLYDSTKGLGYGLDADLVIGSSFGSLSSILSEVLVVDEPTVHIHADLGPDQSWNSPLIVNALTIEGSFVGRVCAATPGIQITSVGVRLILYHSSNKATTHDVEVFGTLNLTLPGGSVLPMELDYTLKDTSGAVRLTAGLPSGAIWVNPMGAQGFVLNPVTFSSSLLLSDPWKAITLDIAANFQYQTSIVNFTGSCVPGGTCSLHANIQEFDLLSLQQLYEFLQHEPIKAPNVDVTIETADLSITSDKGFSATLTNVNIAGRGSGNAALSFSSNGSVIHAELGSAQFGDVTINSVYIQLDLQPAASTKPSDAIIYGDVRFEALETDVTVHLYSSAPNIIPKCTEWTVYAELMSSDNTLALSKIEPRLKGTDFNIALKNALFIAAS